MAKSKKDKVLVVKESQTEGRKEQVYLMRKQIVGFSEQLAKLIVERNDLESLAPRERIDVFLRLMTFICPKPVEQSDKTEERISQWVLNIKTVNNSLAGGVEKSE